MPRMALSGVRTSWLMLARNSLFALLAALALLATTSLVRTRGERGARLLAWSAPLLLLNRVGVHIAGDHHGLARGDDHGAAGAGGDLAGVDLGAHAAAR